MQKSGQTREPKNKALYEAVQNALLSTDQVVTLGMIEAHPDVAAQKPRPGLVNEALKYFTEKTKSAKRVPVSGGGRARFGYLWKRKGAAAKTAAAAPAARRRAATKGAKVSKRGTSLSAQIFELIGNEPGITLSEIRAKAKELGADEKKLTQLVYNLKYTEKLTYGDKANPNAEGTQGLYLAKASGAAKPARAAKVAKSSAEAKGIKRARRGRKSPEVAPQPAASIKLSSVPQESTAANEPVADPQVHWPVAAPRAFAVPASTTSMLQVGGLGGIEAAIADLASRVAGAVAQQISAQMSLQLSQHVSNAISHEISRLSNSIPGAAQMGSAGRAKKKILVVGLLPHQAETIQNEYSATFDLAFIGAADDASQLQALLPEADSVITMADSVSPVLANKAKGHRHYVRIPGGLPELRENLNKSIAR